MNSEKLSPRRQLRYLSSSPNLCSRSSSSNSPLRRTRNRASNFTRVGGLRKSNTMNLAQQGTGTSRAPTELQQSWMKASRACSMPRSENRYLILERLLSIMMSSLSSFCMKLYLFLCDRFMSLQRQQVMYSILVWYWTAARHQNSANPSSCSPSICTRFCRCVTSSSGQFRGSVFRNALRQVDPDMARFLTVTSSVTCSQACLIVATDTFLRKPSPMISHTVILFSQPQKSNPYMLECPSIWLFCRICVVLPRGYLPLGMLLRSLKMGMCRVVRECLAEVLWGRTGLKLDLTGVPYMQRQGCYSNNKHGQHYDLLLAAHIIIKMFLRELGAEISEQIRSLKNNYLPVNYKPGEEPKQAQQLRSTIYTTLVNPIKIEYYFWLWVLYSFYAVVKLIVFLPVEIAFGAFNSLLTIFHICYSRHIAYFSVMTLVACYLFQQHQYHLLDASYMYHLFRGQSTLKLYGLIFAIEVGEKICTMLGKYLYTNVKNKLESLAVESWRLLPEMAACFIYTVAHAYFIFLEFNIYIVVINGSMQNFIIFCFVTNLTKMKSNAFKKFDSKAYLGQINFDAKDRLQKSLYIILFQISQWDRHVPDIEVKLFFIFIIGALIEHIKHVTILIQSGQISEIDNIRSTMFYKMYLSADNRTFMKCVNNDFTVIPFAVFFVKMVGLILYANYSLTDEVITRCYFQLCLLLLLLKLLLISIRRVSESNKMAPGNMPILQPSKLLKKPSRMIQSLDIIEEQRKDKNQKIS